MRRDVERPSDDSCTRVFACYDALSNPHLFKCLEAYNTLHLLKPGLRVHELNFSFMTLRVLTARVTSVRNVNDCQCWVRPDIYQLFDSYI
uniref:Uncharacterized protein n=1 Tax=Trichogramma kaykai TaxID=54128 RepID=A0ABD2X6N6_9HYME